MVNLKIEAIVKELKLLQSSCTQGKAKKVEVFKYKLRRIIEERMNWQPYTKLVVEKIQALLWLGRNFKRNLTLGFRISGHALSEAERRKHLVFTI